MIGIMEDPVEAAVGQGSKELGAALDNVEAEAEQHCCSLCSQRSGFRS